jgi:PAS domain S-box-containing protein
MEHVIKRLPRKISNIIMDNLSEAIMVLSKDFKILWANQKLFESIGGSPEEVIGAACYKVTHRVDHPCSPPNDVCPIFELLANNNPVSVVHKHYDRDGALFYVKVTAIPVKNFWGRLTHFVHIAREISQSDFESAN